MGSQQRLCGDLRGTGFKVNPRVSHQLKLGPLDRADWLRLEGETGKGGLVKCQAGQAGQAGARSGALFGWDQQVREEGANKTGSGPPSRGPETTRVRADQCLTRHSGHSRLEKPGTGPWRRWRPWRLSTTLGSGRPNARGSDRTGCPAVSRRRAVTAALQGSCCHDNHTGCQACGQAANRLLVCPGAFQTIQIGLGSGHAASGPQH